MTYALWPFMMKGALSQVSCYFYYVDYFTAWVEVSIYFYFKANKFWLWSILLFSGFGQRINGKFTDWDKKNVTGWFKNNNKTELPVWSHIFTPCVIRASWTGVETTKQEGDNSMTQAHSQRGDWGTNSSIFLGFLKKKTKKFLPPKFFLYRCWLSSFNLYNTKVVAV